MSAGCRSAPLHSVCNILPSGPKRSERSCLLVAATFPHVDKPKRKSSDKVCADTSANSSRLRTSIPAKNSAVSPAGTTNKGCAIRAAMSPARRPSAMPIVSTTCSGAQEKSFSATAFSPPKYRVGPRIGTSTCSSSTISMSGAIAVILCANALSCRASLPTARTMATRYE